MSQFQNQPQEKEIKIGGQTPDKDPESVVKTTKEEKQQFHNKPRERRPIQHQPNR